MLKSNTNQCRGCYPMGGDAQCYVCTGDTAFLAPPAPVQSDYHVDDYWTHQDVWVDQDDHVTAYEMETLIPF